ncbi:MAG: GNAT family N-acetyltransferase [Gammaproteobacteria bacterium]|jgi:ribosomal protein S18 acetylase RimI-like enzyme|nr:GNAT family N-acetyltransferase [Gammaproteobacteria bacterium]MDH3865204.1 GNAT family N-acetyltransferase [Gammaproteobacteria bacterium]MDH3906926.1 GNAT family N-acetyltransferase [Gammaproteobacteria bacterium]MDH4004998.1 GNAT family N-acetyltransferase [Gammaproteobacteria bacterium]NCF60920.1 GNAT family N-acetyltransferase [Gammaproteobacteria bacterium]
MASIDLTIRDATPGDAEIIADFNSRLAFETEGMRLSPEVINRGVETLLADQSKGRYWVAQADSRVVGQIMVTYEWSDWRNGMIWWIQSVYVHGDYRRSGVFSLLYRHVESLARRDPQVSGIRLYVERDNARARRTYESLGMDMTDYRVMQSMFTGDE